MRGWLIVAILMLTVPTVVATTVDVQYEIRDSQVFAEYRFSDVDQEFNITLPTETNSQRTISEDQTIAFVSEQYLSRDTFQTDISSLQADIGEIRVYLPDGAILARGVDTAQPSVTPAPRDIFSDGRRMILLWQAEDIEPARAILIEYESPTTNWWFLLGGLAIMILGAILVQSNKPQAQNHTKNLFEEEKVLVEILLKQPNKEMLQNALVKESNMSKVKVSRKLQNLEKKEVIEKIPHGNTNKIRLLQ